jgi:hypothetical protein
MSPVLIAPRRCPGGGLPVLAVWLFPPYLLADAVEFGSLMVETLLEDPKSAKRGRKPRRPSIGWPVVAHVDFVDG